MLTLAPPTKALPSLSSLPLLFLTVKKLVCLSAMVIRFPSNSTQTSFGNFETVERAFGFESEYEACAPAPLGTRAKGAAIRTVSKFEVNFRIFEGYQSLRQYDNHMPSVLFVCVHNAGRSQMAAGFMTALSGGKVEVLSAGSAPKDSINPVAVEAMAEVGIDIANNVPKVLTTEAVQQSDVVITMGCGDTCPFFPGKRYEDWVLEDPAGQGIEPVRVIRDEIKKRVEDLLKEII
jgi:arsenate reductase